MTDFNTVTEGGFTASSSSETPEQIKAILSDGKTEASEPEKPSESEAAAVLGKKGGEAAAAKRAEAAKEAKATEETDSQGAGGQGVEPDKSASAESEPEKPLGKPRDDPRARMLEATRKEAEAKREAAKERAQREALEARLAELERASKPAETPKAAPSADSEPQEADYDDYKEFVKATARWEFRQAQKEAQRDEQATARDREISNVLEGFFNRAAEQGKADPEFIPKTIEIAQSLQPSFMLKEGQSVGPWNVISDEIVKSERAPALLLHFQEHPEEIQRLSALRTPGEVQVEVRLLARTLAAAPQASAPPKVASQANSPVRPVTGSPHTAETVPGTDASYEDHKRYWTRKDKERLAQR